MADPIVADRPASHASAAPAAAPRRHLGLEELLHWAYRDQRVHRYLRRPMDWFLFSLDCMEALGAETPRPKVHPDAAMVHAAVMELGEEQARVVFHFAALAERPERCNVDPLPYPIEPFGSDDDFCRAVIGGERRDILVLTDSQVSVVEEDWATYGRKRVRLRGTRRVTHAVTYCPLEWRPSADYILMTNHIADTWEAAIAELRGRLAQIELRAHVLTAAEDSSSAQLPRFQL